MNQREREALDRHITGNYGEDQFKNEVDDGRDWAELVTEFHLARNNPPPPHWGELDPHTYALRVKLICTELGEWTEAEHKQAPVEILDSLVDLLYVVVGTAVEHGFGPVLDAAFREVHRSNMTKDHAAILRGEKYGLNGKGEHYEPPDLEQFFE